MLITEIDNGYIVTTSNDDDSQSIKYFENYDGVIAWVTQFKFSEE